MKHHLLNIVRGGLPVVGAVTGGLTVAKRKPGLLWLAGGSLAGWVSGYVTRNVLLGLFDPGPEPLPKKAFEPPQEMQQPPQSTQKIPDFVPDGKESDTKDPGGQVIDISPKKKPSVDGFGTV